MGRPYKRSIGPYDPSNLGTGLGNNAITTTSSGVRSTEIRYKPWGTTRYTYRSSPRIPRSSGQAFQYTGQRIESSLGLLFYNARWYDSALGRFIQADSIVPGGVQGLDRYAYVGNNPINYTDPSGNARCTDDGNCSNYSVSAELYRFGVKFEGEWTEEQQLLLLSGIGAVNDRLGDFAGGISAFKEVYGGITITNGMEGAITEECKAITSGACTSSAHQINFASVFSNPLRLRNNLVHELGHAFSSTSIGKKAYPDLGTDIANDPNTYGRQGKIGMSYGFASAFGTFDWQMSFTNASTPNEIFADQFLGWTFNKWYDGTWGEFDRNLPIDQANERSKWMNEHMSYYLGG